MIDHGFHIGDAVWIAPDDTRGHVFSLAEDKRLILVTIDGQDRGRWCAPEALTRRDES